MRRRELLALLAGAAAPRPFIGPPLRTIGLLGGGSPAAAATWLAAFRRGLGDAGYVEGRNIAIEYRWAEGHYDRLPAMAAELVRRRVAVIAATSDPTVLPARAATATIPIVFCGGLDPVERGLVKSLAQPGGNVTGVSTFVNKLAPQRVELLHALVPTATQFGLLVDPKNPDAERQSKETQEAARRLDVPLLVVDASSEDELASAFAALGQKTDGAILGGDPIYGDHRERIVALAAQYQVPTVYYDRQFVDRGGLISYGDSIIDAWHRVGVTVAKILKGATPADLPVEQPTRFELAINLKTATALGLTVPPPLLAAADQVIQ